MKIQPIYTLISIALLLGVIYIAEINNLWVVSYTLADDKKEMEQVKQYNTQLNTEIAQYNSIRNVISSTDTMSMERSKFIYLDQNGVLVKK